MQAAQPANILQPTKFISIVIQILLLSIVMQTTEDYIHWGVGSNHEKGSTTYDQAEMTLESLIIVFIAILALEIAVQLTGMSLFAH
jgi:hypothetical protein